MEGVARETLLKLVEEHVTSVVREAITVQRHSKRARLYPIGTTVDTTSSVNDASSPGRGHAKNSIISGSGDIAVTSSSRIHPNDINIALQLLGSEKLYGTTIYSGSSSTNEVYERNKTVMLLEFLQSEELPPAPTETELKYHWLAVDGIQPEIPQNPTKVQHQPAIVSDTESSTVDEIVNLPSSDSNNGIEGVLRVSQLQASLLSEELKLYFTRITSTIENYIPEQQDAALASVEADPGLQELVPFFVRYCQKELFLHLMQTSKIPNPVGTYHQRHMDHADHCRTLVRLVRALIHNPHLHLELHLHELLPALVTCVVAEKLCQPLTTANYHHQHWILRREAAAALHDACQLFHSEYPTLKSRILRALYQALVLPISSSSSIKSSATTETSLASQYGGIVGITLFGTRSIDTFLLPHIFGSWEIWERMIKDPLTSPQLLYEVHMCQLASLNALGLYLTRVSIEEKALRLSWEDNIESLFYDRLIPFLGETSEYATCFI